MLKYIRGAEKVYFHNEDYENALLKGGELISNHMITIYVKDYSHIRSIFNYCLFYRR